MWAVGLIPTRSVSEGLTEFNPQRERGTEWPDVQR